MNRTLPHALILLSLFAASAVRLNASALAPAAPSGHAAPGYLGIDLRDITDDQAAALKQRDARGAEIVLVDHDAPAGKAGLREHDIVLRINGQAIVSQDQARHILHDCPPTSSVVLFVSRDGQFLTVTARMSTREEVERRAWEQRIPVPEPPGAALVDGDSAGTNSPPAATSAAPVRGDSFIGSILMNPSYTGAALEQMTTQLAQFFGVPTGAGLLVRSVIDNSPAAEAGLRAGDVVLRANNKAIVTTSEWYKAVKSSHGHSLTVVVLRDKQEQTLTLTPDSKKRSCLEQLVQTPERIVMAHLSMSWLPVR